MSVTEEPKKPQNAYWLFLADNRSKFESQLPDGAHKGSGVAKVAGEAWKKIAEKERKPYEDKAAKLKAAYDEAMKKFLAAGGEKSKRKMKGKPADDEGDGEGKAAKRGKKEKDPNQPKKPQNAYWLFLADNRPKFDAQVPAGVNKMGATAKLAGDAWKALPDKQRQPYDAKAAKLKKVYDEEMSKYKAEKSAKGGADAIADSDEE